MNNAVSFSRGEKEGKSFSIFIFIANFLFFSESLIFSVPLFVVVISLDIGCPSKLPRDTLYKKNSN